MRHFGALPLGRSGLLCKHAIEVGYVQGDRNQRPSLKPISTAVTFFEWRYGAAALAISSRRRGSAFLLRINGERTTDDLAPDTEPGMRVTGVVTRTTSGKKG